MFAPSDKSHLLTRLRQPATKISTHPTSSKNRYSHQLLAFYRSAVSSLAVAILNFQSSIGVPFVCKFDVK